MYLAPKISFGKTASKTLFSQDSGEIADALILELQGQLLSRYAQTHRSNAPNPQ